MTGPAASAATQGGTGRIACRRLHRRAVLADGTGGTGPRRAVPPREARAHRAGRTCDRPCVPSGVGRRRDGRPNRHRARTLARPRDQRGTGRDLTIHFSAGSGTGASARPRVRGAGASRTAPGQGDRSVAQPDLPRRALPHLPHFREAPRRGGLTRCIAPGSAGFCRWRASHAGPCIAWSYCWKKPRPASWGRGPLRGFNRVIGALLSTPNR